MLPHKPFTHSFFCRASYPPDVCMTQTSFSSSDLYSNISSWEVIHLKWISFPFLTVSLLFFFFILQLLANLIDFYVLCVFQTEVKWKSLSCVWLFATPWNIYVYSPWNSPVQNNGVGSHSLLQWIFLTHLRLECSVGSVQSLSRVQLFGTPWTAAWASLFITSSRSPHKPMSIKSMMPSNHLILGHPLLLLPSIFPSIRVFSNESALHIGGQSIGVSASASVLPMNTQDWAPLGWTGWISLQPRDPSRVFSNTIVQKHQFFRFLHSPTLTSIHDHWKNHSFD